jgi:hypothetical protein
MHDNQLRDESQDMWVFEDGGDCLGVREYDTRLDDHGELIEPEGERYVRFADLEELKALGDNLAKIAHECAQNIDPIGSAVDDMLTRLREAMTAWAATG